MATLSWPDDSVPPGQGNVVSIRGGIDHFHDGRFGCFCDLHPFTLPSRFSLANDTAALNLQAQKRTLYRSVRPYKACNYLYCVMYDFAIYSSMSES